MIGFVLRRQKINLANIPMNERTYVKQNYISTHSLSGFAQQMDEREKKLCVATGKAAAKKPFKVISQHQLSPSHPHPPPRSPRYPGREQKRDGIVIKIHTGKSQYIFKAIKHSRKGQENNAQIRRTSTRKEDAGRLKGLYVNYFRRNASEIYLFIRLYTFTVRMIFFFRLQATFLAVRKGKKVS